MMFRYCQWMKLFLRNFPHCVWVFWLYDGQYMCIIVSHSACAYICIFHHIFPLFSYKCIRVISLEDSVLRLLHGAGKDFTTFVRQADDVDRNRCDGVEEGYAALRVAPNGATGQMVSTFEQRWVSWFLCKWVHGKVNSHQPSMSSNLVVARWLTLTCKINHFHPFPSWSCTGIKEILGATIVGPHAGDHISEALLGGANPFEMWCDKLMMFALWLIDWPMLVTALQVTLCMQHGLTAADLAGTMHPYPTSAEVVRQAAQAFVRSQCLGLWMRNGDWAIHSFEMVSCWHVPAHPGFRVCQCFLLCYSMI